MDNTGIRSRRKKYRRRVRNIRVGLTLFVICLIAVAIPVIREMLRKPAQITIQVADIEVTQGTALPSYTADVKIQDKDKNKLTKTYTAEDFAKDLQKGKDITISSKADSNIEGTYVITAKLSENVWKEAEKMLEQIQKYPQKEEYQKLVEADRINLYEREAEKGDDRKFLEETDRVFKENLKGDPAWKLYERKLVYLESKQPDISREFERFLKKYPKVMDAYVEYSIYLCRNNKMTQAQRVYREGRKQTGMTSKRAEELRRKLGL